MCDLLALRGPIDTAGPRPARGTNGPAREIHLDPRIFGILPALVSALLVACVATPRAQQRETYYFDCDVPPGRFSEWKRTVQGSEVRVSGTIELIEARRDPEWSPVANVFITGKDDASTAGFRLFIDLSTPELVHVLLVHPGDPLEGDTAISSPWRGESVPFTVSFNQSGDLSVAAAGKSQSAHFGGFQPLGVDLGCSSGQFKYRGVSVDVVK